MSAKVFDAQGRQIKLDSRVMRLFGPDYSGGMIGEVDCISKSGLVWVTWNKRTRLRSYFAGKRRWTLRPTYRCPDLLVVTDKEDDA
jgi:hypothetical protein